MIPSFAGKPRIRINYFYFCAAVANDRPINYTLIPATETTGSPAIDRYAKAYFIDPVIFYYAADSYLRAARGISTLVGGSPAFCYDRAVTAPAVTIVYANRVIDPVLGDGVDMLVKVFADCGDSHKWVIHLTPDSVTFDAQHYAIVDLVGDITLNSLYIPGCQIRVRYYFQTTLVLTRFARDMDFERFCRWMTDNFVDPPGQ